MMISKVQDDSNNSNQAAMPAKVVLPNQRRVVGKSKFANIQGDEISDEQSFTHYKRTKTEERENTTPRGSHRT